MRKLFRSEFNCQRGFGLVEVLIAAAVFLTIAIFVGNFILSSNKESIKVEGNSACQTRAQSIVAQFKNIDNKASISNWHSTFGALKPASPASLVTRFGSLNIVDPGSPLTYNLVNSWLLVNSGTSEALNFYNHVTGSCSPSTATLPPVVNVTAGTQPAIAPEYGAPLTSGMFGYPMGSSLPNEQPFVNIRRKNTATAATDCLNQGTQKIIPLGTQNSASLDTQFGFEIVGAVVTTTAEGIVSRCVATATVGVDSDLVQPVFQSPGLPPSPALDVMPTNMNCATPANCCVASTPFCFNVNSGMLSPVPQTCGNVAAEIAFAVNEPGVVFACALDTAASQGALPAVPSGAYQFCSTFSASLGSPAQAVTGTVTKTHLVADGTTAVKVDFTNLPTGYFRLFVKAFDSAQNETVAAADFLVNSTQQTLGLTVIPPPNLTSTGGTATFNVSNAASFSTLTVDFGDSTSGSLMSGTATHTYGSVPPGTITWTVTAVDFCGVTVVQTGQFQVYNLPTNFRFFRVNGLIANYATSTYNNLWDAGDPAGNDGGLGQSCMWKVTFTDNNSGAFSYDILDPTLTLITTVVPAADCVAGNCFKVINKCGASPYDAAIKTAYIVASGSTNIAGQPTSAFTNSCTTSAGVGAADGWDQNCNGTIDDLITGLFY